MTVHRGTGPWTVPGYGQTLINDAYVLITDHFTEKISPEELEEACTAEWLAGSRDPYRQMARCFHIIAERVVTAAASVAGIGSDVMLDASRRHFQVARCFHIIAERL